MKVIVAGSRHISDYLVIETAISHAIRVHQLNITEIVEGEAQGIDTLARQWAINHLIPFKPFKADWDNITAPGAIVLINRWGKKYNVRAGYDRNQLMADYGEALIAIWDGKSTGTGDMIDRARRKGLPVFYYILDPGKKYLQTSLNDGRPMAINLEAII